MISYIKITTLGVIWRFNNMIKLTDSSREQLLEIIDLIKDYGNT